jgi:2-keto-4-pentenoate hydratase/2-oxohepta-3-ene-1,7-dioic acid hydratase in catechol pathway
MMLVHYPLVLPEGLGSVHHEVELAVLIGSTLRQASEDHVIALPISLICFA